MNNCSVAVLRDVRKRFDQMTAPCPQIASDKTGEFNGVVWQQAANDMRKQQVAEVVPVKGAKQDEARPHGQCAYRQTPPGGLKLSSTRI